MCTKNQIVKLNIGGTVFQTTKSTLTKFDGMFKVMMETEIPVIEDESGAIFIDRSPKHFDLILNYMRDGEVKLPANEKEVMEIQKEAHYYLLTGLIDLCDSMIPVQLKLTDEQLKLPIIYSDEDLLRVITKPVKHVLIIYYVVHPNGLINYPSGLDIKRLIRKYGNQIDIYLKSFTYNSAHEGSDKWHWIFYLKRTAEAIFPSNFGDFVHVLEFGIKKILENESRS